MKSKNAFFFKQLFYIKIFLNLKEPESKSSLGDVLNAIQICIQVFYWYRLQISIILKLLHSLKKFKLELNRINY